MKASSLTIKKDFVAGLVVFLVALPLCLGVALASGAPLLSGVIAGVIGGLVVGYFSASNTSVSGPAAGLTTIVLAGITQLGSFEWFLLAVFIAGIIQLLFGVLKSGFIANFIPNSVIKGLLAAIGIILILKQIPHAVGYDFDPEEDFSFYQKDGENTFTELMHMLNFIQLGAIIISIVSISILLLWNKIRNPFFKQIPSSLIVVIVGVLLNLLFLNFNPTLAISGSHLVNIPKINSIQTLFTFPDFNQIVNTKVWVIGFTIAIVASIETLLNIEALENLDPQKRPAHPNRELIAQGIGNSISGLIGGLPITSVIVRSSVNIQAGAQTKLSSILHGLFLLIAIVFLAPIMNLIPLASLASILIFTGFKLTAFNLYIEEYKKGFKQFIPFVITILAIVLSDLLIGVSIGLIISILFIIKNNIHAPFTIKTNSHYLEDNLIIELNSQVSFLNKAKIKNTLLTIQNNTKVTIDATRAKYIDQDVIDIINEFKNNIAPQKNIALNLIGFNSALNDSQFKLHLDKAMQKSLSADQVLAILKAGNHRFTNNTHNTKNLNQQLANVAQGQNPIAIILSCIDSRTTTEHVFDLGLGDIFSVRIAGNILNEDILGSMELAVHEMGVKLIVVLGHTKCGAIAGACNHLELGHLSQLLEKIQPAVNAETSVLNNRDGDNYEFVDKVSAINVMQVIEGIKSNSQIINHAMQDDTVKIVGAMYHIENGKVIFYE